MRDQRGITLRDLARTTGIGHSRLQQLETLDNPNPTLSVLLSLQQAYGLDSIEALLGSLPSQIAYERYNRPSDSSDDDQSGS